MSRNDVLAEFTERWDGIEVLSTKRMADEIVRLREQLAASEPVAWYAENEGGSRAYATNREDVAFWKDRDGWTIRPLYAHPSAAAVSVTDAQVEAVAKALRQRDEGTAWCTWDTIKPQTRALYMDEARKILTAASEGASDAD